MCRYGVRYAEIQPDLLVTGQPFRPTQAKCQCVRHIVWSPILSFYPLDARPALLSGVCVCLSVTSWNSVKTAGRMELVFGTKASLCYKETCLSVVDLMLWCSCGKKKRERFSVTMWQAAQEIYRDGEHYTVNIRCSTKTSPDWSPSPCIWPITARRRSCCLATTFSISGLSPIWLWTNPLYFATLASFPGTYFLRQCQKYRILNNSMHYGVSD